MRLICPSCDAQYEVSDAVIPAAGRDVQCSNCGTTWFQQPVAAAAPPKAAPAARTPPPEAEPEGAPEPARRPPTVAEQAGRVRVSRDLRDDREDPQWAPESGAQPGAAPRPAAPQPAAPPPQQPRVSADAASILREEAMRELKARLAEKPRVETQPDFGLMPPTEAAPAPSADPAAAAAHAAPQAPPPAAATGRDRLPDIEEAPPSRTPEEAAAAARAEAQYRSAFRSGFGLAIAAGLVVGALYVYAPQIGTAVPAARPALSAYVAGADRLRVMIDRLIARAASNA